MESETKITFVPGGTEHVVECSECGVLDGPHLVVEHDAFRAAYDHAKTFAHKITVRSSVTTTVNGYVGSE